MGKSRKIIQDIPLFIANTTTTDNTNEMDRNGMYQFRIPAKAQCIRDIGAIRGSNEHSQGGRGGTRRRISVNKAHIHIDVSMI